MAIYGSAEGSPEIVLRLAAIDSRGNAHFDESKGDKTPNIDTELVHVIETLPLEDGHASSEMRIERQ